MMTMTMTVSTINNCLESRAESIGCENSKLMKHMEELQKKIERAVQEPSEICGDGGDGGEHEFYMFSHFNKAKESVYYFSCAKCNEVVVKKIPKTPSHS